MMKKLALAAVLAFATTGLASTADAGYGHRSYSHGYSYGYKAPSYGYKTYSYGYRHYAPVYTYNTYKSACHYGWVYQHGYKVWACKW